MELQAIGLLALAVFAATVFQTIAGFGYAIIGMPFLIYLVGPKNAVLFLIVSGVYMKTLMLYRTRREISFTEVKRIFLGSCLGVIPGQLVLKFIDGHALNIFLGVTLLLAVTALQLRFNWRTVNDKLEQFGFGMLGGFFTSATSVGGPPIVIYMLHAGKDKNYARCNMNFYFVLCNWWTILVGLYLGNVSPELFWGPPLWTLPAGFLGMWVGEKLFGYINQRLFNKLALLTIAGCAFLLIYKGLAV